MGRGLTGGGAGIFGRGGGREKRYPPLTDAIAGSLSGLDSALPDEIVPESGDVVNARFGVELESLPGRLVQLVEGPNVKDVAGGKREAVLVGKQRQA